METAMQKKYASVQQVDFGIYKRVIVVSDIHGDSESFAGVLKKVNFSKQDALVIVGDMTEKGAHSLEVIRMVMEYAETGSVYVVLGNNDALLLEWLDGDISDAGMHGYVMTKENALIREMAQELDMVFESLEDFLKLKQKIQEAYAAEIQFLRKLPHIIDSKLAVFVHAGIETGNLWQQDYDFCLAAPAFAKQKHRFEKPVIVGHWPVSNYCDEKIDANVYFNKETNVISLDGGNSMKAWQQLNYLILYQEKQEKISQCNVNKPAKDVDMSGRCKMQSGYFDRLLKIRALDAQEELKEALTLTFPNTRIEIIQKGENQCRCFVPYINKEMTLPINRIYEYKQKTYCYDMTTYNLAVAAGEILSFCMQTEDGIWAKRDGIVGNYRGRYEFLNADEAEKNM